MVKQIIISFFSGFIGLLSYSLIFKSDDPFQARFSNMALMAVCIFIAYMLVYIIYSRVLSKKEEE